MSEKLIIKNFGPIKFVDLNIGRFNVLIGDQGTGKSTVAKILIAIQNTVFRELFDVSPNNQNRDTQLFFEYLKIAGIQNYYYENTEIFYTSLEYKFGLKKGEAIIDRDFDLDKSVAYNFNYIPSERSLVITVSDSLFALMQTGTALPQLFLRFGDKFQKARKDKQSFDYSNIIGVNYTHKKSGDFVRLSTGKEIPIQESSSGIQGAITMLTVFDFITKTEARGNLLVIEEPELNCFPETQNKIIKHFVENNALQSGNKNNSYKNQILITTHSPYILTSLNNLMYANQVGRNHHEETNSIIEDIYWLNAADVSAYLMLKDGTCESIIDKEGLIKTEKIDEVSRRLNEEFDSLQNLELGINI